MSFLKEMIDFIKTRKKYWIIPLLLLFILFGAVFVLTQGTPAAPFIYTLF
ncbi:MAG: hypothetical protein K2X47_16710 [Bdellovibrionales bacterium]|nr:hypothetical protein [Bdellovibrionales bacterium]